MALKFVSRGYNVLDEERKRAEQRRETMKSRLFGFFPPKSGDETEIFFMTEEPLIYKAHVVKDGERFMDVTCTEDDDCEECSKGNHPTTKAAWLIWDTTEFKIKERKNGKETGKKKTIHGSVRPLVRGIQDAAVLQKKSENFGLMTRPYTVYKTGEGKQSRWNFEHGDKAPVTKKMIEKWLATLPESLQGLNEYEVLEKQILPPGYDDDNDEGKSKIKDSISKSVEDIDDEDEDDAPLKRKKISLKHKKHK